MLRAMDAAGIELVHHLGLRYLHETKLREKLRCEREHQRVRRLKRFNPVQHGLDERTPNAKSAEWLADRNGLHLNRRAVCLRLGTPFRET